MRMPLTTLIALTLSLAACGDAAETTPAAGGSAGGSAATAPAADAGETLATVNKHSIGSTEFETAAARKAPAEGDSLSLEEKKEVLDRLVDEKLLYEAALAKGLDKDPKVQKVMVNSLLREEVYASVRNSDFADGELQAYYEAHKDEFIVPEKVQIKRILIKINEDRPEADAQAEIGRIHAELKGNTDAFKELAAKYSEDPYRRRGGDVGFVPKTGKPGLDPEVVEMAFNMEIKTLSEPFKSAEGFNIIFVANKRDRVERTFQQMKGSVLRKVKNEKLKDLYDSYVGNLRTGAAIQVNEDKLGALEVKSARRGASAGMEMAPSGVQQLGAPSPTDGAPDPSTLQGGADK